jgi:hypothetical protein
LVRVFSSNILATILKIYTNIHHHKAQTWLTFGDNPMKGGPTIAIFVQNLMCSMGRVFSRNIFSIIVKLDIHIHYHIEMTWLDFGYLRV